MIKFPIRDDAMLAVIEPGNVARMKAGYPLIVSLANGSTVMLAFTPDVYTFVEKLGVNREFADVAKGDEHVFFKNISAAKLDATLKECIALPEVER